MKAFEKCPVCAGELIEKEVEKLLRGGIHSATVNIKADVCTGCGERLYSQETVRLFEDIRKKLEIQDLSTLKPLGQFFSVEEKSIA